MPLNSVRTVYWQKADSDNIIVKNKIYIYRILLCHSRNEKGTDARCRVPVPRRRRETEGDWKPDRANNTRVSRCSDGRGTGNISLSQAGLASDFRGHREEKPLQGPVKSSWKNKTLSRKEEVPPSLNFKELLPIKCLKLMGVMTNLLAHCIPASYWDAPCWNTKINWIKCTAINRGKQHTIL